jgi:hypothetical protein
MSAQRTAFNDIKVTRIESTGTQGYPADNVFSGSVDMNGALQLSVENVTCSGTAVTLSLEKAVSILTVSASTAITLAKPSASNTGIQTDRAGLVKKICVVSRSAGTATVTYNGSSTAAMSAAGLYLNLVWSGTAWVITAASLDA